MPKPTQAASSGPAILGSNISAFIGKYGQPNDHTDIGNGSYHFQRYANSNQDGLIVQTDIFDQGYQRQVYGIAVQAPPSQPWSASTVNSRLPAGAFVQGQEETERAGASGGPASDE